MWEAIYWFLYVIIVSFMIARYNFKGQMMKDEIEDINLDINRLHWRAYGYNATWFENRIERMYAEKQSDHLDDGLPVFINEDGHYQIW